MKFHEMSCHSALNKIKSRMPYSWDLNIYRGCSHRCKYCYAIYSHDYFGKDDFFDNIYIKTNIIDQLEKELHSPNWKREIINIGGITDTYQHAEEKYKLMPEILKLLIKYKTPAIISTKSILPLRDYDLIDELSRITYINIAATITTTDETTQRKIEPGASSSKARFNMLKEFRKTNASVGLHFMPIIPYITDSYENINELFAYAKDSDVHYVLPGTLYLRGKTRVCFFDFIRGTYPELYNKLSTLYKTGGANKTYKDNLYIMLNQLKEKYALCNSYSSLIKEKLPNEQENYEQLSFFNK